MKTTIEVKDYQIVIEETENEISVTAIKDDETMEEFTLNLGEESEGLGDEESDDDVKSFDEFGDEDEEEDFENPSEKEGEEESDHDDDDDEDDDDDNHEEKEEKEPMALESFQSFINRRRK